MDIYTQSLNNENKYNDIINLPHHQSKSRKHMSLYDRAAQFSPFAALTGYEDAVEETARLTEKKQDLSEDKKTELSAKLSFIQERMKEQIEVVVTYFMPDEKKDGGKYTTVTGIVRRIDDFDRTITFQNQDKISLDDIVDISGEAFRYFF